MTVLRRFASVFAVALAVLVTVQTLDVLPCSDEAGQSASGHIDDGQTIADCLCHVAFTRTETFPTVAAAPATPPPAYAPFVARLDSADGPTVDHVPLA